MAGERLMIVEDERIVAEDLRDMLERLNYQVVGLASSGEEAIRKCDELQPDLVLMDIRLNGALDGIEAAETIWAQHEIPVTYLTAYADEHTLERAKATLPFGYILKPFEERDLRTTVEIALYKSRMQSTLRKMEGWYASALESLSDAVIATNPMGNVTFMNPAAESLTGWPLRQAYGKKFRELFPLTTLNGAPIDIDSKNSTVAETSAPPRPTGTLRTKHGSQIEVQYGLSSMQDQNGQFAGTLTILHALGQPHENVV